jgi:predicted enzyme related to lactoylglutathione lyase
MAHLIGLDFVALQVHDLQASRRFYTAQLGLEVAPQSPPNAVVFRTEPIPFAVRDATVDLDQSQRLGWGVALWFLADDADALHAALVAQGVPIAQPPQNGSFGRMFSFVDPDGYIITVHGRQ